MMTAQQDVPQLDVQTQSNRDLLKRLGRLLGEHVAAALPEGSKPLITTQQVEADSFAVPLQVSLAVKAASTLQILWLLTQKIPGGDTISPTIHKYLEHGSEGMTHHVIARPVFDEVSWLRSAILSKAKCAEPEYEVIVASVIITDECKQGILADLPADFPIRFITLTELDEHDCTLPPADGMSEFLGITQKPMAFLPDIVYQRVNECDLNNAV
ncbi:hypothetical protein ACYPKM_00045 [Pseudomonas aeruginosa]